jgi:hypothetical protein
MVIQLSPVSRGVVHDTRGGREASTSGRVNTNAADIILGKGRDEARQGLRLTRRSRAVELPKGRNRTTGIHAFRYRHRRDRNDPNDGADGKRHSGRASYPPMEEHAERERNEKGDEAQIDRAEIERI